MGCGSSSSNKPEIRPTSVYGRLTPNQVSYHYSVVKVEGAMPPNLPPAEVSWNGMRAVLRAERPGGARAHY